MAGDRGMKNLWPKGIAKARDIQNVLRRRVEIVQLKKIPSFIAAVDAAFTDDRVIAVASLYTFPALEWLQDAFEKEKTRFPYIPGLLTFREGHAVINALKKLKIPPEVILFDGQGIAHPRGIGIASHIGVLLEKPTIGCAKSRLIGEFDEPDPKKGSWTFLYHNGTKVGAVLRTRSNVKPLFISPGHMVDVKSSIELVMECLSKYRIPEPLRRADLVSKRLKHEE